MAEFVTVATVDEVPPGEHILFSIDYEFMILFNIDGEYHVIANKCTHDDGPLEDGEVQGHTIACPRHGAAFDIRTGEALSLPATQPIPRYEVRVMGDEIQVAFGA